MVMPVFALTLVALSCVMAVALIVTAPLDAVMEVALLVTVLLDVKLISEPVMPAPVEVRAPELKIDSELAAETTAAPNARVPPVALMLIVADPVMELPAPDARAIDRADTNAVDSPETTVLPVSFHALAERIVKVVPALACKLLLVIPPLPLI